MTRIEDKLECPKCHSEDFLEGPHGGAAVNIKCAGCGYFMNVTRLQDGRWWITDEGD
ncbi:hypothetical protein ES703_39342 [subsurface metagenome]